MTGEGIDLAEQLVLLPLEASPKALWELRWHAETTLSDMAGTLRPGLLSLDARGFIEVRRFHRWPAPWAEGVPLTGADLARESARIEVWSAEPGDSVLAAHITEAGWPFV